MASQRKKQTNDSQVPSTRANSSRGTEGSNVSSRPSAARRTLRSSAQIDRIREQGAAARKAATPSSGVPDSSAAMTRIKRQAKPRSMTERPEPNAKVAARAKSAYSASNVSESSTSRRTSTRQAGTSRGSASGRTRPNNQKNATQAKLNAQKSSFGHDRMLQGVWTKGNKKAQSSNASQKRSNGNLGRSASSGRSGRGAGGSSRRSIKRWPFIVVAGLVAVLFIGYAADSLLNGDKIYSGVTIGDVEVAGLTTAEASELVSSTYSQRVAENTAVFYANEEAQANPQTTDTDENIEEQISYEESLSSRTQWTVPATEVEASIDVDALVSEAYEVGRSNGGPIARLQAMLGGWAVELTCTFNDSLISELSTQMTAAVGTERVNYNIAIEDSVAYVTDGHDGNEVTEDWIVQKLNETYLGETDSTSYILETQYMELQVTEEEAQKVADQVNASIASGANFTFEDQTWQASREELANWITTELVENGSSWELKPRFDETTAKASLFAQLHSNINEGELTVTFEKADDGTITVSSNATGTVPLVSDAITSMNDSFFVSESRTEAPTIEVSSTDIPSSMSFADAQAYGLVTEIASYTTQYSSGASARVNNIHTAANLLTNSIAKANGGSWSFNDIAGEATEERGYQNAGAIVGGVYSDAIGGGICQVATTVFNAIYDAGYPITERHNHTLRISSYPDGRDAAIAYPTYDLVWENDSTSDVLLVMSYTDSSVTATLWGVDPGYQVSTEYGEWVEGEAYSTTYTYDDTLASGTEYVSTTGVNGSSITIVRTVTDAEGNVLHTDTFSSNYQPKDEVITKGTATTETSDTSDTSATTS